MDQPKQTEMRFFFSSTLKVEEYDGFHLLQDHVGTNYSAPWNDYDYIVTFQIYRVDEGKKESLGYAKVLAEGFKDTSQYFTQNGEPRIEEKIFEITSLLNPSKVVSLAKNIDFYNKLRKLLDASDVEHYLDSICDASYHYSKYNVYKEWPGFNVALLRDGATAEAILKKGHQIAVGRYVPEDEFQITIEHLPDTFDPVDFSFDNKRKLGRTNVNLLIGKNGVGKTYILRRLIELITGIHENRESWPYFHKLIVAAYSPFENFYTKNALIAELDKKYSINNKKSQASMKSRARRALHINEYSYIGFKNDNDEFSLAWPKEHAARSLVKIIAYDKENSWWDESSRFITLYDTLKLCIDFDSLALKKNDGQLVLFNKENIPNLKTIKDALNLSAGLFFINNDKELPLSSGQMIYSYMLPCLVAEIENESLIIIDEPELYLHPALEIGLINMMKSLLTKTSSYAIIATHSAVMTREVERKGIRILKAKGGRTLASEPTFETFGESLELIIGEAFDDYETKKPYQQALDTAISEFANVDDAIQSVGPDVGDEALAYIASKIGEKADTEIKLEDL